MPVFRGRRTLRIAATAAVASAALAAVGAGPAAAAPTAGVCRQPLVPAPSLASVPWPQKSLGQLTLRSFSSGAGVTVAVVDTGVDPTNAQLRGRVLPGFDFLRQVPGGDVDCDGHGTGVASVIVAQARSGIGFSGLAPAARVLPLRVAERAGTSAREAPAPAAVTAALDAAVAARAGVIVVPLVVQQDTPALRAAVARAVASGAVVIAAAGDRHDDDRFGSVTPAALTPYPAAYPGVIGVGAAAEDGTRVDESQIGTYVDVLGPGDDTVCAVPLAGHTGCGGTGVAAGFVAAAAALVRAANPSLSGAAVSARLLDTASPAAMGTTGPGYGKGLVDPYRALTEALTSESPTSAEALPPPVRDLAAEARAAQRRRRDGVALAVAAGVVLVAVAVGVGVAVVPRGRRRRWRPANRPRTDRPVDAEPLGLLPSETLFRPRSGTRKP